MRLLVQLWEESELNWGVRPDGYSLHVSEPNRRAFIAAYWETMPDNPPREYSRPSKREPYWVEIEDETVCGLVRGSRFGERFYDRPPKMLEKTGAR